MTNLSPSIVRKVILTNQKKSCGVFGIYAPEEDVAKLTYFGLYALQHRGQESAGIATFEGTQVHLAQRYGLGVSSFQ